MAVAGSLDSWVAILAQLLGIVGGIYLASRQLVAPLQAQLSGLGIRLDSLHGEVSSLKADVYRELGNLKVEVARLVERIQAARERLDRVENIGAAMAAVLPSVSAQDPVEILRTLGRVGRLQAEHYKAERNPITQEELDRLRNYLSLAEQGTPLTREQLYDYDYLVRKLAAERPGDPGLWPLIALGGFLLGLLVSGASKPKAPSS